MREAIAGNKLKYVVVFEVDETWIADGFDLTDERAFEMLNRDLAYAYGHELEAKVTKAPPALLVAQLQGYSSADHIENQRKEGKR